MKNKFYILLLVTNIVFLQTLCFAKEKFSWDFSDCEIKEMLYAVSIDTEISITADDTVYGKCDFRFSGNSFEDAFDSFLKASRLYAKKDGNIWTVSRFNFQKTEDKNIAECSGLKPVIVMGKLGKCLKRNITFDSLPGNEISFHLECPTDEQLIENVIRFLPGYVLEKSGEDWHIAKKTKTDFQNGEVFITKVRNDREEKGERIKVDVKNVLFSEAVENLFSGRNKSFCFISNCDVKAVRTSYEADSFEKALDILCSQNGFSFTVTDDVYYFSVNQESKNTLIYGISEWEYFPLKYLSIEKILPVLAKRFPKVEIVNNLQGAGFWGKVTCNEKKEICEFLNECDVETKTYLIKLKNIKASDFLKRLPPSVNKNDVCEADGNACLYFTGTEENYNKLIKEVECYDRPQLRLKYDLLILQYDETSGSLWSPSVSAKVLQKGDRNGGAIRLGNVLSFNVNIISAFGLDFAAALQTSISENKTRVFADTSLHGLAGKEISFTNTNTYRYRDNNLDPETGKPVYSGVTREIISGLKLDVSGWVSEDGMITSSVKASVTRRGTDTSSITGNPPPTSEKIVMTEVCAKSGEPVILSGLLSESDSDEMSGIPVASKIPVLGGLFKNHERNREKSQMVIILVPSIENEKEKIVEKNIYDKKWAEKRMEGLCRIMNLN